jgi:spore maturation protein CgeB
MRLILFCHSLLSDWNHGNAHFLRGIVTELQARGHEAVVYEPEDAWSLHNLLAERGEQPLRELARIYPTLRCVRYRPESLDLDEALEGADAVLVHEWNEHALVRRLGLHRARHPHYRLLFNDTHHRSVTDRASMAAYDLRHYDGCLAFGRVIRDLYLAEGWTRRAWTWHEAADPRVFHPLEHPAGEEAAGTGGDVVWIGNWGDDERSAELREFLLEPVRDLNLRATIYGVRYPAEALAALRQAGIAYGRWLPNFAAPAVYSRFRATVHVPRGPYVRSLPGVPTIRPFEALACGIPLVTAPWEDAEDLFTPGRDFLVAHNGAEMRRHLRAILHEPELAASLRRHGRSTILRRHTCAHRVDELLAILAECHAARDPVRRKKPAPRPPLPTLASR